MKICIWALHFWCFFFGKVIYREVQSGWPTLVPCMFQSQLVRAPLLELSKGWAGLKVLQDLPLTNAGRVRAVGESEGMHYLGPYPTFAGSGWVRAIKGENLSLQMITRLFVHLKFLILNKAGNIVLNTGEIWIRIRIRIQIHEYRLRKIQTRNWILVCSRPEDPYLLKLHSLSKIYRS